MEVTIVICAVIVSFVQSRKLYYVYLQYIGVFVVMKYSTHALTINYMKYIYSLARGTHAEI